ncbi:hypothetical protein V8C35DRAFT_321263 [Trichoderma chlorosporum]
MRAINSRPQFKARIRRWRHYQPTTNPSQAKDSDAEITPRGPSKSLPLKEKIGWEFINAAHPHDAISPTAISSIRSHAARDIHASRRALASQSKGGERRRKTHVDTNKETQLTEAWSINLMIPIWNNLLYCFVRPITKLERFLLNYYATSVIPNARLMCHHGDEEHLFLESVRLHWLPFVVTDSGLLAGIFLSSCRNLALYGHQTESSYDYCQIAMMYKLECIKSVNAAIATEGPLISESTIAKTLLLCADEYMCENLNASALHFAGLNKMIELKGGLSNVGVSGFLGRALKLCSLEKILRTHYEKMNNSVSSGDVI